MFVFRIGGSFSFEKSTDKKDAHTIASEKIEKNVSNNLTALEKATDISQQVKPCVHVSLMFSPIWVDLERKFIVECHFFGLAQRFDNLSSCHRDRIAFCYTDQGYFLILIGQYLSAVVLRLDRVHSDIVLNANWAVRIDAMFP